MGRATAAALATAAFLGIVAVLYVMTMASSGADTGSFTHGRMALRMDTLRSSERRSSSRWGSFGKWFEDTFLWGAEKKKSEEEDKRREAQAAADAAKAKTKQDEEGAKLREKRAEAAKTLERKQREEADAAKAKQDEEGAKLREKRAEAAKTLERKQREEADAAKAKQDEEGAKLREKRAEAAKTLERKQREETTKLKDKQTEEDQKARERFAQAKKAEEEKKHKAKQAAKKLKDKQAEEDQKARERVAQAKKAEEEKKHKDTQDEQATKHKAKQDEEGKKLKDSKYCAHRCPAKRMRKDWALMSQLERRTYIKAVKKLYDGGVYHVFVRIHQNGVNDPFAHGTSAFLPWHRKYLLELENALRCLGEEFECVTLPYWDWAEWQYFCNKAGGCPEYNHIPEEMAAELAKDRPDGEQDPKLVTSVLEDFGGPGTKKQGCKAPGCLWGSAGLGTDSNKVVGCVQEGPFAGWKDWDGHCLSRGVDWKLPATTQGVINRPFTTNSFLLSILLENERYGRSYANGYRGALQNEPHNNQHNYLGGHMRSMRSPMDPIFFTHHSMVDKQWARWQDCNNYEDLTKQQMGSHQYIGNALTSANQGTVGEDDSIDVDMPYFLANEAPFVPNEQCSSAKMGSNGACHKCLGENFPFLQNTWCISRWIHQCTDFCARDQCRAKCGSGGGHRELKDSDFKLKGDDGYAYRWDHDKLGSKPRDWILATTKYEGGSKYHYQQDAFDRVIGESACKMMYEKGASPAQQQASATSFLEMLSGLDSAKGKDFKSRVGTELQKLIKVAEQKGGKTGSKTKPDSNLLKRAVQKAATAEMKNQCGLQSKSDACDKLPEFQGCTYSCSHDLTDEHTNSACIFNAFFGAPTSSENLKWSSTCQADYQTDEDYAATRDTGAATPRASTGKSNGPGEAAKGTKNGAEATTETGRVATPKAATGLKSKESGEVTKKTEEETETMAREPATGMSKGPEAVVSTSSVISLQLGKSTSKHTALRLSTPRTATGLKSKGPGEATKGAETTMRETVTGKSEGPGEATKEAETTATGKSNGPGEAAKGTKNGAEATTETGRAATPKAATDLKSKEPGEATKKTEEETETMAREPATGMPKGPEAVVSTSSVISLQLGKRASEQATRTTRKLALSEAACKLDLVKKRRNMAEVAYRNINPLWEARNERREMAGMPTSAEEDAKRTMGAKARAISKAQGELVLTEKKCYEARTSEERAKQVTIRHIVDEAQSIKSKADLALRAEKERVQHALLGSPPGLIPRDRLNEVQRKVRIAEREEEEAKRVEAVEETEKGKFAAQEIEEQDRFRQELDQRLNREAWQEAFDAAPNQYHELQLLFKEIDGM